VDTYDDTATTAHVTLSGPMDYPLHAWLCTQTALGPTNVAAALVHASTVGEARAILQERERDEAHRRMDLAAERTAPDGRNRERPGGDR